MLSRLRSERSTSGCTHTQSSAGVWRGYAIARPCAMTACSQSSQTRVGTLDQPPRKSVGPPLPHIRQDPAGEAPSSRERNASVCHTHSGSPIAPPSLSETTCSGLNDASAQRALRTLRLLVEEDLADVYSQPVRGADGRLRWNVWLTSELVPGGRRLTLGEWAAQFLRRVSDEPGGAA